MRRLSWLLPLLLVACATTPAPKSPTGSAPAGVTDGTTASSDGVSIHYRSQGSGSPAVVMIHCWSCDASYWDGTAQALAGRYRVVAIDLAGHGASGTNRTDWSMPALAKDVQAVVEKLDLKSVVLVGHSMGGNVALEAARLMKDRVVGIVPVDTLLNVEYEFKGEEFDGFMALLEKDFQGNTVTFVRNMFPKGSDPAVVEKVASDMAAAPPAIGMVLLRANANYDPRVALKEVQVPMHSLNGDMYPSSPEINQKYNSRWTVTVMPNTGHFPMFERPDQFNALLLQAVETLSQASGE